MAAFWLSARTPNGLLFSKQAAAQGGFCLLTASAFALDRRGSDSRDGALLAMGGLRLMGGVPAYAADNAYRLGADNFGSPESPNSGVRQSSRWRQYP